jgi:hypothetical protein
MTHDPPGPRHRDDAHGLDAVIVRMADQQQDLSRYIDRAAPDLSLIGIKGDDEDRFLCLAAVYSRNVGRLCGVRRTLIEPIPDALQALIDETIAEIGLERDAQG